MVQADSNSGDFTAGERAIWYQNCRQCRRAWYFRRDFCPACGAAAPRTEVASGCGTIAACTVVARAPSAELRAHAPYAIVLVDAVEGFRLMGQGNPRLAIGNAVKAEFVTFGDRVIPYFQQKT